MKTRKVSKSLRKFVLDSARDCASHLGVSHYNIDVFYMKEPKEDDGQNETTQATIDVHRRYLTAKIKIYPSIEEKWKAGEKEFVRVTVFHEISHILTQHLYDCAIATYIEEEEMKDAWESLTESISRLALSIDNLK